MNAMATFLLKKRKKLLDSFPFFFVFLFCFLWFSSSFLLPSVSSICHHLRENGNKGKSREEKKYIANTLKYPTEQSVYKDSLSGRQPPGD